MTVRVLGPLETGNGEVLSPRERAVFAALIIRWGSFVSSDELAEAYWGDSPPRTWAQQIKTSIARIRAALGADAVTTVSGGYALGLDPDLVDAARFEKQVSSARSHALRGEPDRALDVYRRALALWRGPAYPDLASWPSGADEAARLAEIRMSAEEEALQCRLALGEHRVVIPDAERLVRAAPLREERWAILALGNYRAGRQAEALAALQAARTRLSEELGIDLGHRLSELETAILRQDAALDAPSKRPAPSADCPYQGLEAFGIEDADEFFGRDDEAERILERLRPGLLLVLAGASGSGKSSLAMAGVLRRVIDRGQEAHVLRVAELNQLDRTSPSSVVLVDQFEELFQLDAVEVDRLVRMLREGVDAGSTVLVTVRSDFLDRCLSHRDLAALFSDRVVPVLSMSREQLHEVIERPAERARLRIEPGLTDLVLRDAADHPAALPLLSHALRETWVRREAGVLTVDGYRTVGGFAGAVANSAEWLYRSWNTAEQKACRALMLRLIERGADGSTVRRAVPLRALQMDPVRAAVISALVTARLLSVDQDAVTISHETVVDAWPRLGDWLVEDTEDSRMLAAISSAATSWSGDGRSADDLLHGARLEAALDWQATASPDLTEDEREFLTASKSRADAASREIQERALRDRRQNRLLRWAIVGASALLVAALIAGGLAAVQRNEATVTAENRSVEALVATSLSLVDSDPETAALLAAEAFRRWPDDPRVRSALWGAMTSTGGFVVAHHEAAGALPGIAAIPDTDTVLRVLSREDRPGQPLVEVVDIATGGVVRTFDLDVEIPESPPFWLRMVAVSADGSTAAIQSPIPPDDSSGEDCCWNHLTFFDLSSGELLAGTGVVREWMSAMISLDDTGRTMYVAHPFSADVMTVDTTTGEVRASSPAAFGDYTYADLEDLEFGDPQLGFAGLALVDGGLVAVSAGDHIRLYDRATLALSRTIPLEGDASSMDLVADGQGGIVATGWDGTVRVDLDTGDTLWRRVPAPTAVCFTLHPATDTTVACASNHGVDLMDLASGEYTGDGATILSNYTPLFETIDAGSLLVSLPIPPTWWHWRVDGGNAGADIVAEGRVLVDGPDADGSLAVTRPAAGGQMQLWDLERDVAVGEESELIVPLGSGVVARYDSFNESGGAPRLEQVSTGEEVPLRIPGLPDTFQVSPGTWDRPAFASWEDRVVAFDPVTGEPLGPVIALPDPGFSGLVSISETPEQDLAIATWWTEDSSETAVFDIATGQLVARGLYGLDFSLALDADQFVGVAADYTRRYDIASLEPVATIARAVGGSQGISVSADHRTLLNVAYNNTLSLYDLTTDIPLATPIEGHVYGGGIRGGFLTADGETMLQPLPDSIRVWDMRPAEQALRACTLAGRELTEEEWSTYLPGEERVDTCAELSS